MNDKYIPLYRKYRPQKLEEIVGQEHIKKALTNAISMNRISHAYLFTGPRGTGKTSTARIFAKSLNCIDGPTISPCNECENCKNITNSIPIDVIEIDAASNRSVNDADEIIKKVVLAPVQSRYKIYIIDEVHMLTPQAFNALLKTLEEPPANVIFILATTEVHKVLDTIKSRCQRFDFRRITTDDIVKHLRYISDKEKINITDDALFTIAKNSAGGMRDSIALLDQLSILDGEKAISTDDINALLGRISFDTLKELSDAVVSSNPQSAIEVLEKIYNSGNEPTQILQNLLDYFKNMLIVKNCKPDIIFELTQLNEAQIKELTEQVKNLETQQMTALIDKTSDYIKEIKTTNNPRLWLEVGIIDLANLTENTRLADLQNRLARLEGGAVSPVNSQNYVTAPTPISTVHKIKEQFIEQTKKPEQVKQEVKTPKPPTPEPVQKTEQPQAEPEPRKIQEEDFSPMPKAKPIDSNDISVLWGKLLDQISSAPTKALLKQWANPVKITAEETIITLKNEMFLTQVNSTGKKASIIKALDAIFSQENSNVIMRLPLPEDVTVKPLIAKPLQMKRLPDEMQPPPLPDEEEIQEAVEEVKSNTEETEPKKKTAAYSASHSDQVNMVMDLFDGKIIE
ncbi:DNA polymerase III subunit gamma/tau [bacterium]|nr:DNA polymerase III subunit gamma/tau [bacterium]